MMSELCGEQNNDSGEAAFCLHRLPTESGIITSGWPPSTLVIITCDQADFY